MKKSEGRMFYACESFVESYFGDIIFHKRKLIVSCSIIPVGLAVETIWS